MFQFNHFNFNVLNLEKSLEFYKEALGLDVVREKDASDGSFKIVYPVSYTPLLLSIQLLCTFTGSFSPHSLESLIFLGSYSISNGASNL